MNDRYFMAPPRGSIRRRIRRSPIDSARHFFSPSVSIAETRPRARGSDLVEVAAAAFAGAEACGASDAFGRDHGRAAPGFAAQRVVELSAPAGVCRRAVRAQAALREARDLLGERHGRFA